MFGTGVWVGGKKKGESKSNCLGFLRNSKYVCLFKYNITLFL